MPFTAIHLLFINLLTDSLPAIAIGMEPSDDSLLKEKPRNPKEGILTKYFIVKIILQGALIGIATMSAYYIGLKTNTSLATTMAFATLTIARLFHGFNCRGKESIRKLKLKTNPYQIMAFVAIVLFVPQLHGLFEIADFTAVNLLEILGLAFVPTLIIQIVKEI